MCTFTPFPKIPRYSREIVITEKIDGTNAQIYIYPERSEDHGEVIHDLKAGSRNRWLTPTKDNFGFCKWAYDNADELIEKLGPGRHYGEWWGVGIQRGYGLQQKKFSLFNTTRWRGKPLPSDCDVVPILSEGIMSDELIEKSLETLKAQGSLAAPGFMNPEGIVIYHEQSNSLFKKTIKNDDKPKIYTMHRSVPAT